MSPANPSSSDLGQIDEGLPPVAPDEMEQNRSEHLDDIVPTRGYEMTPMVGLGGSAGSISALTEFFKAMPPDTDMVFVVILHLSPTHVSTMADLLGRATTMTVVEAENSQLVKGNHVYVIPPGKYLTTTDGHLKLTELENDRGKRVAVDLFFRSLADTHGPRAAAIVLSGAGDDGALGIKRIKERGGLTIAQDPDEAEHSGMPRTSIDTGMVDWVLQVKDIPSRLLAYRGNGERLKLPPEQGPPLLAAARPATNDDESALRDILAFLRARTGRDFAGYKRATVLRRIGRRMQVNGMAVLEEYRVFLRTHPGEAGALLQDLLVSVTNFFRDRDSFEAIERRIPELFKHKSQSDTVRVWVPACATGDEAYSMAMLLLEHARTMDSAPALQVFACDLNNEAIQTARNGLYPATISADVSDERLRRFFTQEPHGYRVRREVREMVLFATHDLLKDPPFSRMDLISCRNLLIYLNRDAQRLVLETFHFAANPGALLFLGSSETVDDTTSLFGVIDKKHRIYVRQGSGPTRIPVPAGPGTLLRAIEAQETQAPAVHGKHFLEAAVVPFQPKLGSHLDRAALADLHFRLLERFGPPSVVVNAQHEVVHVSERAGAFLRVTGGAPTIDLVRLIHPELQVELRMALFRATESNAPADALGIPAEM
ncbi:MAG TPA: chemotaxis protein CheB, partial [Planctomycetaceae bacterium]|nr:chemotaxis protein CheB [Planctomycetaceae bacterium]